MPIPPAEYGRCISRQRHWGVPIPAFYHVESGDVLMTDETIAHVQARDYDLIAI